LRVLIEIFVMSLGFRITGKQEIKVSSTGAGVRLNRNKLLGKILNCISHNHQTKNLWLVNLNIIMEVLITIAGILGNMTNLNISETNIIKDIV